MLARIKESIKSLRLRALATKIWYWPKQSKVMIFDACGQEYLLECLSPWHPEVLYVRGEQINMLVFLASLFRGGKRSQAYVDSYIQRVRPRLIVTFIDNNPNFFKISQRHPTIKTLFLQNGWRGYYADIFELLDKTNMDRGNGLHVDYMMTFGAVAGSKYAQYVSGTVVPMGSIKSNSLARQQPKQRDVIAFVSQWLEDGFYMNQIFYTHEAFFGQADRPVLLCLTQYAKDHNKRLLIIPRHRQHSDLRSREAAYFREILGCEPEFLEPKGKYPSYQAVDAAEVVVTIDSTLGYESVARGNKTAIFSIRSSLLEISSLKYGWPGDFADEGLFWTNYSKNEGFVRVLDYLFSTDNAQWQKDVEESCFASLMLHDPANMIFKSIIEKELGPAPLSAFVQPGTAVPDKLRVI